jgi:hypothetical protein
LCELLLLLWHWAVTLLSDAENVAVKAPTATAAAVQPLLGSTAPQHLAWTFNGASYRLYKRALNWRMAEASCRDLGPGFHLASITSLQELVDTSDRMVNADEGSYGHGGAHLVGCKPDAAVPTVWVGLHDPKRSNQSSATWLSVAQSFVWSDGQQSPFLLRNTDDYFASQDAARQQEHCIGFTFCLKQSSLAELDKHPCDWEMSYLCKAQL